MINIYSELKGSNLEETLIKLAGKDFSTFKPMLSEIIIETICPIGKKIKDLLKDQTYLKSVIQKGKEKANLKAEENLKKIREIVGLV